MKFHRNKTFHCYIKYVNIYKSINYKLYAIWINMQKKSHKFFSIHGSLENIVYGLIDVIEVI